MKLLFSFSPLLLCLAVVGQDLHVNFEGVAAGTTDSAINMGTISRTNGTAVTFSWTGSAGKVSVENGGLSMGLLRPVTIGGTSYTNAAPTKHLLCRSDNTVSSHQKFTWTFAASRKISVGFAITISNFTGLGSFYNAGALESGGTYSVLSLINNSPPTMQAETNSDVGARVAVPNNVPIWATCLWDSANRKTIWDFYNLTNGVFIGRSTGATALNATIATLTWGITDAHSKDAGTAYRMNNLILYTNGTQWPVWPGGSLQMPTNFTPAGVAAAIAAASSGETILLPATNTIWTSGVTLNKSSVVLAGIADGTGGRPAKGTNSTIILADGIIDALTVSGNLNTVSNFCITGDGSNDEATGIVASGVNNIFMHLFLKELEIAFYNQGSGLFRRNTVLDCDFFSRNIPGDSWYNTYYPLPLGSTNQMVYELCVGDWSAGKNTAGSSRLMSSQNGQAFTVRHCSFYLNKSGASPQPFFDYHGDNPPSASARPGTFLAIYSNVFVIGASSISGAKFAHVRGSVSQIYSNVVMDSSFDAGQGIVYVEEHPEESPSHYPVTNSYAAYNFDGVGGVDAMPVNDDGNVNAGVEYFLTLPDLTGRLAYPHPASGELMDSPPPDLGFTPAPPRLRGIRLLR